MFDLGELKAALAARGRVVRVVVAAVEGSGPREVGAAMLVWEDGQSGTIGGGALEFRAVERARGMLAGGPPTPSLPHEGGGGRTAAGVSRGGGGPVVERVPLGPGLGQCCGGAVTLWFEVLDRVPEPVAGVVARGVGEMPLAVTRVLAAARGQGVIPAPGLVAGWMVEPVAVPARQVWVWGAGHVGRALVAVLAPLPGVAVTWVDTGSERFPEGVPGGVTVVPAARPEVLADHAPVGAEHVIVTYSHALDLELCHRLLRRGFGFCGLIGSATKWARFRSRLAALGHGPAAVGRITCPIGEPGLGKHPQAIALGVAVQLLRRGAVAARAEGDGYGRTA